MTELKFEQLVLLYAIAGKTSREAVEGKKKNNNILHNHFRTLIDERLHDIKLYAFISI